MTLPKHCQTPPLRELLRRLRKHAPLKAPIRVRHVKDPMCWGEPCIGRLDSLNYSRGRPRRFALILEARLSRAEKWDILIHEWAHALDRGSRKVTRKNCHDSRFGQHWARAFRASLLR